MSYIEGFRSKEDPVTEGGRREREGGKKVEEKGSRMGEGRQREGGGEREIREGALVG